MLAPIPRAMPDVEDLGNQTESGGISAGEVDMGALAIPQRLFYAMPHGRAGLGGTIIISSVPGMA